MFLPDNSKIVQAFPVQTMGSAATGDWVSLKGYERCMILVHITNGHASSGALTVDKATDVAGSNESAGITLNNVYAKTDYVQGTTTATALTKQTAAASFVTDATITTDQWWVVDIAASDLPDSSYDYDCIQVNLALSNAGNLASGMYILYNPRYTEAAGGVVEPILD